MAETKVILTKTVANLGHSGDVVEVKSGFARNYLIPQGLPLPGFEGELVEIPIRAEGLSVTKSLAWRADNDNPMVPLFLEIAKR